MTIQSVAPGARVELFDIDMSTIWAAGPIARITPATESLAEIARGGNTYTACPVGAEGFERGGTGALPSPKLTVANVGQILGPWVEGAQDLIGAEVTRTVVLADWLDGNPGADPAAAITVDTFVIAQKTVQDKIKIAWALRSPLDVRRQVPFRKALPKCSHTYRLWDASTLAFVAGTCPYAGAGVFDWYNSVATDPTDFCNHDASGCEIRFPSGFSGNVNLLPFKGFPGL
jgi:lambda family phage minor tail protein L